MKFGGRKGQKELMWNNTFKKDVTVTKRGCSKSSEGKRIRWRKEKQKRVETKED